MEELTMGSRIRIGVAAATTAAAFLAFTPTPAYAATYSAPLRTAVANLAVATENRAGYNRDLFPHWIDADGDRCNTRNEVLITEATTKPSVSSTCALTGGRWYSYYDNATWTNPSDLDIDHVVALAEAWDSGARTWPTSRRQAFANDLGDSRSLIAVTDNVNQSKSDKDPAEWLPPQTSARCRFITEWVVVKIRWRLTVNTAEKNTLTSLAASCTNSTISLTYAW
jgi:hypothetical protein